MWFIRHRKEQVVQADAGYDALKKVTVNPIPGEYIVPSGNLPITSNGNNINVAQYETAAGGSFYNGGYELVYVY